MRRRFASPRAVRGVGLLEVLLAVVLISIGFLAAARMQMQGLRYSQNAYALSQAKFMLLDMSERMRANRSGLLDGAYDGFETVSGLAAPACLDAGSPCSPAELATADRHAWSAHLHAPAGAEGFVALLPSAPGIDARGRIERLAGEARQVSVRWAERGDGAPVAREVSVQVMP